MRLSFGIHNYCPYRNNKKIWMKNFSVKNNLNRCRDDKWVLKRALTAIELYYVIKVIFITIPCGYSRVIRVCSSFI